MPSEVSSAKSPPSAQRLAAYLPATLARQILEQDMPQPGVSRSLTAATLFSDVSGFTAMSEELASDGPRGAEELNRVLLLTFTAMIDLIHEMGGAVSHFYGDAMLVYFPDDDGQAARRALACAQMMQQTMLARFQRVKTNRPAGKDPYFELTIKIGVGYGRCHELVVGELGRSLEFVLAGPAVDEAAAAEKVAKSGRVVASRTLLAQAGLPAGTGFFTRWEEPLDRPSPRPLLDWSRYDQTALEQLQRMALPFIPPAVVERMAATSLENLAEHRPVTSLFVQFDDREATETAVYESLQQYYVWASDIVSRFGSQNARLNRVLTGDKGNQLHIIFGAPVAPDAPDQATLCALALQQERPTFISRQRIGLSAGKVFAGPVGSETRHEYTVVGDVVNLSARLMQVCANGEVLTDAATAGRVRDFINFDQKTPVQLKGKQQAIAPYRPHREQMTTTQLQAYFGRWRKPLVGREEELAQLQQGMASVLAGNGRVAILSGRTGVGKTRLLAAAVREWLDARGRGLVGVCHPHTSDTPYAPWRNIWVDLIGLASGMDAQAQAAAVVEWTRSLAPDVGDDVGLWAEVLGLPIPRAGGLRALTAEVRQARFFTLVRRCLQAVAANQSLLIILEDVHWADKATLALVDDLAQRLDTMPLCLAITTRVPLPQVELAAAEREEAITITLSDLTPASARGLVEQLIGTADLPPAVERHLGLRDREGRDSPVNPLFLEEALKVMMGMGVLQVNGRVQVNEERLAQMQVPDTIHGMLLARLDRLPPARRDLLQVASVIGRQFAREPLSQVVPDLPRPIVANMLAELSAEEITQLVTADPEWIYLFQHAMTHEVAYESLPYSRRQDLHAAVADWLRKQYADNLKPLYPVLAYHYDRAGNHPRALEYAIAAADAARDVFANQEAVELYTLAERHLQTLEEDDRWETAVDLYLSRAKAWRYVGDFDAALSDAQQALALASRHQALDRVARAHTLVAEFKYRQNEFEEVESVATRVIDELAQHASDNVLAGAYRWAGNAASSLGQYDVALERLDAAETLCLASGNKRLLVLVLESTAFVYYVQNQLQDALDALKRSVGLSHDVSIPAERASVLNNVALIQLKLGQPEDALATYDEAIELVRDNSRNYFALFLGNKGEVLTYLGEFATALSIFRQAIDLFKNMNDERGLIETYLLLAYEYYGALQQWDHAAQYYEKVTLLINGRFEDYAEETARLLLGKGQIELQDGNMSEVQRLLAEAGDLIESRGLNWWLPVHRYFMGRLLAEQQRSDEARAALLEALQAIDTGCPDYLPLILLQLARLEEDRQQQLGYVQDSLRAAETRSRFVDKLFCFREIGRLLLTYEKDSVKRQGRHCLQRALQLKAKLPGNY